MSWFLPNLDVAKKTNPEDAAAEHLEDATTTNGIANDEPPHTDEAVESIGLVDDATSEMRFDEPRSTLRQRKKQTGDNDSNKMVLAGLEEGEEDSIDTSTDPSMTRTASSSIGNKSMKLIVYSTKAIIKQELDKHESMSQMFQLYNDTYSFLLMCEFQTSPFAIAFIVYCLQMTLYGLAFASATDFESSSNPLQIPANVEVSVTVAQFLALGIAIIVQDSLRESLFLVENYNVLLDNVPGITQLKLLICFAMKLSESVLSLILILVLICQKDDVIELLMDFAALLFVSSLDNIVFRIGKEGYLGKHFRSAVENVKGVRFHTTGRKKLKIILRTTAMVAVYISLLVTWIILCPVRQASGYYLPDEALVQFPPGSSDAALPFFTGVYKLDKGRVFDRRVTYVEGSRSSRFQDASATGRRAQEQVDEAPSQNRSPAYFAYCKSLRAWVFVAANTNGNSSPCSNYNAISSEYLGYDLLDTADLPWYINNNANEPIAGFFLQELSSEPASSEDENPLYGLRQEFDMPCTNLQLDELKGDLLSTRKFASHYEILKDSEGQLVNVYTRPVYVNEESSDIIFFTGGAWILTGLSFMWDFAPGNDLSTYLVEEFHAYWSKYDSFLVTETIGFSSEKDAATPVGLNWFVLNQQSQEADLTQQVDAILLCTICDEAKNPCFYEGECQGNGTCLCTTGSSGVLCQVPPASDGKCDPFFNSLAFNWDGGDCCKSTCKSNGKQNCGRDSKGIFPVDFVLCHDPDVYRCPATTSNNLCWSSGGNPLFGESNNAESGFSVSASESVLVVGEPGADSVRVFDRFGSEFLFRDLLPSSGLLGTRFGTSVSVSSSKNIHASTTRLIKPVVAATSATGVLKVFDWSYTSGIWEDISPSFVALQEGDPALLSVSLHRGGSILAAVESNTLRTFGRVTIWQRDLALTEWVEKDQRTCDCSDFSLSEDAKMLVAVLSRQPLANVYQFQNKGRYTFQSGVHLRGPAKVVKWSDGGLTLAALGFAEGNEYRSELCLFDRENKTHFLAREKCIRVGQISSAQKDSIEMNEEGTMVTLANKGIQAVHTFLENDKGSWVRFDEPMEGSSVALFGDFELIVGSPFDDTAGSNRGSVSVFAREKRFCEEEETLVEVSILLDDSPEETWWQLLDSKNGSVVMQKGPFIPADAFLFSKNGACVKQHQCLSLYVHDTRGNGISAPGFYSVQIGGSTVTTKEFERGLVDWVSIGPGNECPVSSKAPEFMSSELYSKCGNTTCDWQNGGSILGEGDRDYFGMVTSMSNDGSFIVASARASGIITDLFPGSIRSFTHTDDLEWQQVGGTIYGANIAESSFFNTYDRLGEVLHAAGAAEVFVVGYPTILMFDPDHEFCFMSQGAVRVFHLVEKTWEQKGNIIFPAPGDSCESSSFGFSPFGKNVALTDDGNMVATTGTHNNSLSKGYPFVGVYAWDEVKNDWVPHSKQFILNKTSECGSEFGGLAFNTNGTVLAVACPGDEGSVKVLKYNSSVDEYSQIGMNLVGENQDERLGFSDGFKGDIVSLSADGLTVAVGAKNLQSTSLDSVRIWQFVENEWTRVGQVIYAGRFVSLSSNGKIVVIGNPGDKPADVADGRVAVFHFVEPLNKWVQLGKSIIGGSLSALGSSVSATSDGLSFSVGEIFHTPSTNDPKHGRVQMMNLQAAEAIVDRVGASRTCGDEFLDLAVVVKVDEHPADTSYQIISSTGQSLGFKSFENESPGYESEDHYCLDPRGYPRFVINDRFHDGICCDEGEGHYRLTVNDKVIRERGEFEGMDTLCLVHQTVPLDFTLFGELYVHFERIDQVNADGSTTKLWQDRGESFNLERIGDIQVNSASVDIVRPTCVVGDGCFVYTFEGVPAFEPFTGIMGSIQYELSFEQNILNSGEARECIPGFGGLDESLWFGKCQESLCDESDSLVQMSLKERSSCGVYTGPAPNFDHLVDIDQYEFAAIGPPRQNLWRLMDTNGKILWKSNSSEPLLLSNFWACAPENECLTFTLDWRLTNQSNITYEEYLHFWFGSFSLWYREDSVLRMTDTFRFPKAYQLGKCSKQQCMDGTALFHLSATARSSPSAIWGLYGTDKVAMFTHGFSDSDANKTYGFEQCLPRSGSYLFASVLGSGVEFNVSWDSEPLALQGGAVAFGQTLPCLEGMVPVAANLWFPRSAASEGCIATCDDGYGLLRILSTAPNDATSASWHIFGDDTTLGTGPIWTQTISPSDGRTEEHLFCLLKDSSHYFLAPGSSVEYNVTLDGSIVHLNNGFGYLGVEPECEESSAPFNLIFQVREVPELPPPFIVLAMWIDNTRHRELIQDWHQPISFYHRSLCVPECVSVKLSYFRKHPFSSFSSPDARIHVFLDNETSVFTAFNHFDRSFCPGGCVDAPGWYDADGPFYNCEWYSVGTRCARHGHKEDLANFNMTANQACCACQICSC